MLRSTPSLNGSRTNLGDGSFQLDDVVAAASVDGVGVDEVSDDDEGGGGVG